MTAVVAAILGLIGWNWLAADTSEPPPVYTTEADTDYDTNSLDRLCAEGEHRNVDGECISALGGETDARRIRPVGRGDG